MKNNAVGYTTIIILLSLASIFSFDLYFQQRAFQDKLDIRIFPYRIDNWQGKDLPMTEKEYDILETHNLILREYVHPSGQKLTLFIIYSETNRAVFHPPEVCLIGSGMKIVDRKSEEINHGKDTFSTNKLYVEKDNYKQIVLYCYKADNLYTDNYYLQQAYFAFNQLLGKHVRGATVRVSMPQSKNKNKTLTILKSFLNKTIRLIDDLPSLPSL
jgi:EpsI family protein